VLSSASPAQLGQSVTFTATVAPSGSTPFTGPTGAVHFYADGNYIGSADLVDGTASLDISSLELGDHEITAEYGGDGVFASSVSDPLTQSVIE
jgi:hypothetical protein